MLKGCLWGASYQIISQKRTGTKYRKNEIPISVRKMYKMGKRSGGGVRIRIKSKENMRFFKNQLRR